MSQRAIPTAVLVAAAIAHMKETLNSSSLGPTAKKREVAQECRNLTEEKDGVLAKYYESLACVWKQFALWWRQTESQGIRNNIRDSKFDGAKKALSELLRPNRNQRFLQGMRVPDWVLLYFKLLAKLPDAAWQTLLISRSLEKVGKLKSQAYHAMFVWSHHIHMNI